MRDDRWGKGSVEEEEEDEAKSWSRSRCRCRTSYANALSPEKGFSWVTESPGTKGSKSVFKVPREGVRGGEKKQGRGGKAWCGDVLCVMYDCCGTGLRVRGH